MKELKAYVVQERPFDWMCGQEPVLVYANNAKEAIKIGSHCISYEQYTELRAKRAKDADNYKNKPSEPSGLLMRAHPEVHRDLGWQYEGDSRCDGCGLATLEGLFPLCEDCEYCAECGCDKDCSLKGLNNE